MKRILKLIILALGLLSWSMLFFIDWRVFLCMNGILLAAEISRDVKEE